MAEKPQYTKFFMGAGIVLFCTVPVFRSGGRTGLTGFQWLKEHTIWGSPIQYIPSEDIARELYGVKLVKIATEIPRVGV